MPRPGDCGSLEGCFVGTPLFANDDGFVIANFEEEATFRRTVAKGTVIPFRAGMPLRLHGKWEESRYGTQFRVESYEPLVPTSARAIEAYIGSGLVPGIGERTAMAIVAHFGEDTLRVMAEEPERLREVGGVGPKLVESVRRHFRTGDEEQEAMAYLMGLGLSAKRAAKARKHFGESTVERIQTNPYDLLEVQGIPFPVADAVALALGWPEDHPRRVQEGVLHYLWKGCQDGGHAFLAREDLVARVAGVMGLGTAPAGEAVVRLAAAGRIVVEDAAVYPRFLYDVECDIARAVLADTGVKRDREGFDRELAELEGHLGIELHDRQREAVWQAATAPLSVLTGGPGTGKTTTLRAILSICERYGERVVCGSPTGRAAKRMAEVTGRPAYTIHRMLGLRPAEDGADETGLVASPIGAFTAATVVVLDEFSMADMALAAHVVRNLGKRRLVLVGDVDQLPSVGPGRILRDIIDSGAANVTVLTEIFRQAQDSGIVMNARRINAGESPRFEGYDDFHLVEASASQAARKLVGGTLRALERRGYDLLRDVQVLSPMKKGEAGIEALNAALQERLNPRRGEHDPEHVARSGAIFRRGDKVMQTRNDYERDVFNGDQGYVMSVEPYAKKITVDFGDGLVPQPVAYDFGEVAENLLHAYCITTHRGQGGEWPAVVVVVTTAHYAMLERNLLYTAITRARDLCAVVGEPRALAIAAANDRPVLRNTRLAERIRRTAEGQRPPA